MSSFSRLGIRLSSALALCAFFTAAGCGDEIGTPATCSTAADCNVSDGMFVPECCAGFCVAASPGCDSGYRYVTTEPEIGECVVSPMCPAALDMSIPRDMSSHD